MTRPDDKAGDVSGYDSAVKTAKVNKGWDLTTREVACILAAAATFIVAVVSVGVAVGMLLFRWLSL